MRRQERPRPASTAYVRTMPPAGLRGRLAAVLYRLARWVAGTTPCPVCLEMGRRIGAGGRGAERRAWREAWKSGRAGSGPAT